VNKLKDENKTKAELIKELKFLREEREKGMSKDITKPKQTEQVIQESESRLRELFNHMSSGVVIYEAKDNGKDFIIKNFNRAAEKIEKVKKEDIIGRSVLKVFPGVKDFGLFKVFQEVYKTGKPQHYPITLYQDRRITGWRENYVYKLPSGEVVAVYDDITERKQAEEKIKHLNLVLRAIRSVNQLITKEKNRESLLKGACNNLIKTRGYHSAWIALLDEGGKLETYAEAGLGKAFLPIVEMLKKGELTVCGNKALKQQKVVITKDPASTCTECPLAQEYSGRGTMTIRLEHSGKVYGFASVSIPTYLADNQEEKSLFKEVVGDIAFAIHDIVLDKERKKAEEKLQETHQKLKKTMDAVIDTMSKIIEVKDPYTAGHQHRVSQLAKAIAKELNLSPDKIEGIRIASLIHDIGKISVPTEILSKSTKLTDIEFSLIKGHSQIGYDILKSIDFSYPIAQIVLQHHERLNGSGYPHNLKDDEILLEARILGVADVVEAMSSHRPYRSAKGIDAALEEISQNRGILYDPEVVDACLGLFKEKGFKFEIVAT